MRNRTENQVTAVLIRHGATKANRERRYLGRTDEPLSGRGVKALLAYREQNCYPKVSYLFSSPMRRCLETAEILYPGLRPVVIPEWEEMDFGAFEYKNCGELREDTRYQEWLASHGTLPFPEGESREDFLLRCENGFKRMCRTLRVKTGQAGEEPSGTGTVGMIVHGGTIMALLSLHCGGDYYDYQASNGRGYACTIKGFRSLEKPVERL